jgi:hypothetical protein
MNAATNDGGSFGHGCATRCAEDWYVLGDKSCIRASKSRFSSVAGVGICPTKHSSQQDAANSPYANRRLLARGYVTAPDRSQR